MSETKPEIKTQVQIKVTNKETVEKFHQLITTGQSNTDFLAELLDCYEKFSGKNCSVEPKNFFPNLQGADRKEKEPILREMFELNENDPLLMSECELLKKASEYSGKTLEEMALEGRELFAKNEIGRQVQYKLGRGKKGTGDEKIAQTYEFLKQSGQKLSLNRLTQLSGSNRTTVDSWCKRNSITFE